MAIGGLLYTMTGCDGVSGGNLLAHGALNSSLSISDGDVGRFVATNLDVSLD